MEQTENCAVCLFPLNPPVAVPRVCGHLFHKKCFLSMIKIDKSIRRGNSSYMSKCPICRRSFNPWDFDATESDNEIEVILLEDEGFGNQNENAPTENSSPEEAFSVPSLVQLTQEVICPSIQLPDPTVYVLTNTVSNIPSVETQQNQGSQAVAQTSSSAHSSSHRNSSTRRDGQRSSGHSSSRRHSPHRSQIGQQTSHTRAPSLTSAPEIQHEISVPMHQNSMTEIAVRSIQNVNEIPRKKNRPAPSATVTSESSNVIQFHQSQGSSSSAGASTSNIPTTTSNPVQESNGREIMNLMSQVSQQQNSILVRLSVLEAEVGEVQMHGRMNDYHTHQFRRTKQVQFDRKKKLQASQKEELLDLQLRQLQEIQYHHTRSPSSSNPLAPQSENRNETPIVNPSTSNGQNHSLSVEQNVQIQEQADTSDDSSSGSSDSEDQESVVDGVSQQTTSGLYQPKFICNQCPRQFPTQNGIRQHVSRMHGERFCCRICKKDYPSSTYLKRHMIKKHNIQGD